MPAYGHLPYVMGQGNKKLSKRDPEAHTLEPTASRASCPRACSTTSRCSAGRSPADRDVFTLDEMVDAFDIKDVNPNPARFDLKKAEAINTAQLRLLPLEEITERVLPFLKAAGVVDDPVHDADPQLLELAMPLVGERINKLTEVVDMLGFLFVDEADFTRTGRRRTARRRRSRRRAGVVRRPVGARTQWCTAAIDEALRVALVEGMELKPRVAFGPVRIAVTGRQVSPPLFESLELLGRERSLARLRSRAGLTGTSDDHRAAARLPSALPPSCTGSAAPAGGAPSSGHWCSWCWSSAWCRPCSASWPSWPCSWAGAAPTRRAPSSMSPPRSRRWAWPYSTCCSARRSRPAGWCLWLFHRLKPRWLSSVAPRLRWRFLLACLPLSVVALVASVGVSLFLPVAAGDEPVGAVNDFTTTTRDFLLVIALLTPLQAAGEEYVFRGYLTAGVRLAAAVATGVAWCWPSSCRRCSSRWRTGSARARRCSSTGSPSAWWPASW